MTLYQIDGSALDLNLHPGQQRAWNSKARFIFIIAGTQSGKTSFNPWWLWRETQLCGPGDYIAATASYDLFKLKFLPEMREVFEHTLRIGRYWSGNKVIELKHPTKGFLAQTADDSMYSRIILRSSQSKGGLESTTAKAAVLDECGQDGFTLEDWEAVLRRLSLEQGRVLGTTTPYNLGWLKSEIFDQQSDPDIEVINFSSIMNPAFPKEEYERAKRKMQPHRFSMFYDGLFAKPASLIYKQYSTCQPFDIPDEWERVIGVDFGGGNQCFLHAACNPETGKWYLYYELLDGSKTTREHAELQLEMLSSVEEYSCTGGAPGESQQRRDFSDAGLSIYQPAISDVESGIDKVDELLKSDYFEIFDSLSGIKDELGSYKRKMLPDGTVTGDIENKRLYHRLDSLRYMAIMIMDKVELNQSLMGFI